MAVHWHRDAIDGVIRQCYNSHAYSFQILSAPSEGAFFVPVNHCLSRKLPILHVDLYVNNTYRVSRTDYVYLHLQTE